MQDLTGKNRGKENSENERLGEHGQGQRRERGPHQIDLPGVERDISAGWDGGNRKETGKKQGKPNEDQTYE